MKFPFTSIRYLTPFLFNSFQTPDIILKYASFHAILSVDFLWLVCANHRCAILTLFIFFVNQRKKILFLLKIFTINYHLEAFIYEKTFIFFRSLCLFALWMFRIFHKFFFRATKKAIFLLWILRLNLIFTGMLLC